MSPIPASALPVQRAQELEDFFVYQTDPILVAAGKTEAGNLIFDQDADFSVQKLTGWVTDQGNPPVIQAAPILLVQWRAGGSGRDIFHRPVPYSALFGTGQLPFILPTPRLIVKGSTVIWTVTNLSATAYTVYLDMLGKKTFRL